MSTFFSRLPVWIGDDRMKSFLEHLKDERRAIGDFTDEQVFIGSCSEKIPTIDDNGNLTHTRLSFNNLLVHVYDLAIEESVTEVVRRAIKATWPERDDISLVKLDPL